MRREWIEIAYQCYAKASSVSPSMRREWIEMKRLEPVVQYKKRLPPCGGSGLKF